MTSKTTKFTLTSLKKELIEAQATIKNLEIV